MTQSESAETNTLDTYIKIFHWNLAGITPENKKTKTEILANLEADIISAQEIHLYPYQSFEIPGFEPIIHSRTTINKRAKKAYGGVALFLKHKLYDQFHISIIDKSIDDILGIKLVDKISNKEIIIYSVYISPFNSTAGGKASEVFTYLLTKAYEYNLADTFLVMGDFNSRIGHKEDFIPMLDPSIPARQSPDPTYKKDQGEPFLDFLNESVCCVLNGRFDPRENNFTYLKNGESVVDWMVTPITNFHQFKNFKVHTMFETIQKQNLANELEKTSHISDHSILSVELTWSTFDQLRGTQEPIPEPTKVKSLKVKRQMPVNFLENEMANKSIQILIDKQLEQIQNQAQVDDIYKQFLTIYFEELFKLNLIKGTGPKKKRNKPWWCDDLQNLWNEAIKTEKDLKTVQNARQKREKSALHKIARQNFDKKFKHLKAAYKRRIEIELEENVSKNPNEFWNQIKNLGPKNQKETNFEVYDENGTPTNDIGKVLKKWENDTKAFWRKKRARI
jgi:hypothetical protein